MEEMKKIVFAFILFFLLSARVAQAYEGWIIDKFSSDIRILNSGEIKVSETIDVDFNQLDKHGIFRDIPYIYDDLGEKTYSEVSVEKVLQNGQKAKFSTSRTNGYIELKIGDPNRTISGKNSYTIEYIVKGVLRGFEDHDELYWNVTGNGWPVSITSTTASVTFPSNVISKIACYQGGEGSTIPCSSEAQEATVARFQTSSTLGSHEGLTIVVGYKKGLIPLPVVQRPKTLLERMTTIPSLTTLFSMLVAGIGLACFVWFKYGRDAWFGGKYPMSSQAESLKPIGAHETVVVEYEAPEKLLPAEIGVLVDERADTLDVVATIIDLSARGYLTITEIPKKWLFGTTDYLLTKKSKDETGLREYEQYLLQQLFDGKTEKKVSSLKTEFYEELKKVKEKLYEDVVSKKLFPKSPQGLRQKYMITGFVIASVGAIFAFYSASWDTVYFFDLGIGVTVAGVFLLIISPFMSKRTAYGREVYRRVRGYQLFISQVEKYRQPFFERKNMFNEVLPYAIVFGLTEKFANAMKDMGVKVTQPGWYYGSRPFNIGTFNASMSDFSNSMSSAIASAPKSSGFSGGGSSGGGFGGGGGGSW